MGYYWKKYGGERTAAEFLNHSGISHLIGEDGNGYCWNTGSDGFQDTASSSVSYKEANFVGT